MNKDYRIKIKEDFWADEEDDITLNQSSDSPKPRQRKGAAPKRKLTPFAKFAITIVAIIVLLFIFVIPPSQTVFLIAGTDEGGTRTDTIMLGVLNSDFKSELTVISIPRDTLISVSDKTYNKMCKEYPQPGGKGMKINEIHHFAGEDDGMKLLCNEIEDKFDIDIDCYAKVNFDAFSYVIDSIGGVTFDVPVDMYYTDPVQNLSINLTKGVQVLDGAKAEQLMRFRSGYARADLERVEVQQAFLKAFLSQALTPKNLLSHAGDYIKACTNYIDTDFNVFTSTRYISSLLSLNFDEIETATLPGTTGSDFGRSGYIADFEEFTELYAEKYR